MGVRFGDEEPEQFIIQAVERSGDRDFRRRLGDAVRDNLQRVAQQRAVQGEGPADARPPVGWDSITDEQVASLAFLISELGAAELVRPLYAFACGWFVGAEAEAREPSFGQTHVLRTLAHLQTPGWLGAFWQALWERGPRALRGLTIFGWARAAQQNALAKLGELGDSAAAIDLPATLWSLIGPEGPGIVALGKAAKHCTAAQRHVLRQALEEAGADQHILRDFDRYAKRHTKGDGRLPWLDKVVPDRPGFSRHRPRWTAPVAEAA